MTHHDHPEVPVHLPTRRFTLTSLFVLVAIFALAFAVISPFVYVAREASREMACSNNLKQIGLALHTYHDTFQQFPPNGLYLTTKQSNNPYTGPRSSRGSVLARLVPYMESSAFYISLSWERAGQPWGFGEQQAAHQELGRKGSGNYVLGKAKSYLLPTLQCPSAKLDPWLGEPRGSSPAISCYAPSMGSQRIVSPGNLCADYEGNIFGTGPQPDAMTWKGYQVSGVFAKGHWAAKFRDIVDGQSQVIAFGEILPHRDMYQRLGWIHSYAFPAATVAPINYPVIGVREPGFSTATGCNHYANRQTSNGFRSRHKGGTQVLYCDGSTDFLSEDADYLTLQRLGDRRDGQPLNGVWSKAQTTW